MIQKSRKSKRLVEKMRLTSVGVRETTTRNKWNEKEEWQRLSLTKNNTDHKVTLVKSILK